MPYTLRVTLFLILSFAFAAMASNLSPIKHFEGKIHRLRFGQAKARIFNSTQIGVQFSVCDTSNDQQSWALFKAEESGYLVVEFEDTSQTAAEILRKVDHSASLFEGWATRGCAVTRTERKTLRLIAQIEKGSTYALVASSLADQTPLGILHYRFILKPGLTASEIRDYGVATIQAKRSNGKIEVFDPRRALASSTESVTHVYKVTRGKSIVRRFTSPRMEIPLTSLASPQRLSLVLEERLGSETGTLLRRSIKNID